MSERDELARDIFLADNCSAPAGMMEKEWDENPTKFSYAHAIADGLLAAGYRKPRTITTAEELDALACGAIVLDLAEWLFRKQLDARYVAAGSSGLYSAAVIDLPATVLYEPTP